jgi:FkbM family methyltransferase
MSGQREREIDWLQNFVDPARLAIDIGANEGIYTYRLSELARKVHAFEPNPEWTEVIECARLVNIEVHRLAISSRPQVKTLYVPRVGAMILSGWATFDKSHCPFAENFDEIEVTCKPLDWFEFTKVSFIKLDVEGHELAALEGAERTLSENRPVLLAEVESENRASFERIMRRHGYSLKSLASLFGVEGTPANMLFLPNAP